MKQGIRILIVSMALLIATTVGVSAFSNTVNKSFIEECVTALTERIIDDGYYSQSGKYIISDTEIYSDSEETGYLGVDDYGTLIFSYYYLVNGEVTESVEMSLDLPYSSYVQPEVTIFYESPYYLGAYSNFDASEYEWEDIVSFSQTKGTDFSKSFINRECSSILFDALAFWNGMLLDKVDMCLHNIGFTSLCDSHETELINEETCTCTDDGYTGDEMCFICGEIVNVGEVIPAAHSYGLYTTTKKAGFGIKGTQITTCQNDNCTSESTKEIPALNAPTLSKTTYTFDNKAKKPSVTVKNTSEAKVSASVSYASGRKAVGKYSVKVTVNTADYQGTKTVYFKINPAKPTSVKLTKGKKQFKVSWAKPNATYRKQITGYEVKYATTSSKLKTAKPVTVKGSSITSKTIKNLKKGKTYKVQVRTYKTVKGKKYYSAWSGVKSVKVK